MSKTVLILGASGRFGRNATEAFGRAGWAVRRFDRQKDRLREAVHGVQVIVNAWNPAYYDWAKQVPKLHAEVIAEAKSVDATVIIPGNVYVYGPDVGEHWSLTTPHNAANPLGKIRRDMERTYRDSGVRTILLRAGDFIDTEASGNWFDMIITKKIASGIVTLPGLRDAKHAWAYLPDLARAAVMLAEKREQLNCYEEVLYPGFSLSGAEMVCALEQVTGGTLKAKVFPWWVIRIIAPFWKLAPHILEMRYLWDTPHQLDGSRLDELLPAFEETSLEVALRSALPAEAIQRSVNVMSTQTT